MEVLNLIRLFWRVGFPWHKLYPYSLYIGEDSSNAGTDKNVWWFCRTTEVRPSKIGKETKCLGFESCGWISNLRSVGCEGYRCFCCCGWLILLASKREEWSTCLLEFADEVIWCNLCNFCIDMWCAWFDIPKATGFLSIIVSSSLDSTPLDMESHTKMFDMQRLLLHFTFKTRIE